MALERRSHPLHAGEHAFALDEDEEGLEASTATAVETYGYGHGVFAETIEHEV